MPIASGAIAVTGADNAHGRWQYLRDGGSSWGELAGASGGSARLLAGSDLVRFVPDADWNGTTTLGFRAPTEGYDGTTERLLAEMGFNHHLADPHRLHGLALPRPEEGDLADGLL